MAIYYTENKEKIKDILQQLWIMKLFLSGQVGTSHQNSEMDEQFEGDICSFFCSLDLFDADSALQLDILG